MSRAWKIRLTQQAEAYFLDISIWTTENFGVQQAASYDETFGSSIEALNERAILRNPLKLPNLN
jgi:plasmid stabilization system protein ParE